MIEVIERLPSLAVGIDGGWLTHVERVIDARIASLGNTGEAVVRLGLAALLGGIIGLEREIQGHEAGFRTFMLVAAGSALAMIVSLSFSTAEWVRPDALPSIGERYQITVDPARIAYSVMTGVGFLGAGTIIQRRDRVQGLTTAAGIWSIAALGLAVGFGLYVLSVTAAILLLLALWVLGWVRSRLPSVHEAGVRVRVPEQLDCVEKFEKLLRDHGMKVSFVRFHRLSRRKATAEPTKPPTVMLDARIKYMHLEELRKLRQTLMSSPDYRLLRLI